MSKLKLSILFLIMSAISLPALAGEAVVKRVPAGAVAFHFVFDLNYVTGEFVGYVGFIEGVDAPLFTGEPSKDTAYFTMRITKQTPAPKILPVEQDPALVPQLIMPGAQFTVFFNANPGPRDWNSPDDFSTGVPIAVFEESASHHRRVNTAGTGQGVQDRSTDTRRVGIVIESLESDGRAVLDLHTIGSPMGGNQGHIRRLSEQHAQFPRLLTLC